MFAPINDRTPSKSQVILMLPFLGSRVGTMGRPPETFMSEVRLDVSIGILRSPGDLNASAVGDLPLAAASSARSPRSVSPWEKTR